MAKPGSCMGEAGMAPRFSWFGSVGWDPERHHSSIVSTGAPGPAPIKLKAAAVQRWVRGTLTAQISWGSMLSLPP